LRTPEFANSPSPGDHFGWSVAISSGQVINNAQVVGGYAAVVGAPGENRGTGDAWIFDIQVPSGEWKLERRLDDLTTLAPGDHFGWSVAMDGATAVIGGQKTGGGAEAVYVFDHREGGWAYADTLDTGVSSTTNNGQSVTVSGDTILVGDPGEVEVFNYNSDPYHLDTQHPFGSWSRKDPLQRQGHTALFGSSVAISGDTAVVGDPGDNSHAGAAYIRELGAATGTVIVAPVVESVAINAGDPERSMVNQIIVTFGFPVDFNNNLDLALEVHGVKGGYLGLVPSQKQVFDRGGQTVVTLTFPGPANIGGSLPDGVYALMVDGNFVSQVTADGSTAPAFGSSASRAFSFYRLFGDGNGDGHVDSPDAGAFRKALGKKSTDSGYVWYFDYNGDGTIDRTTDYVQFVNRLHPGSGSNASSAVAGGPAVASVPQGPLWVRQGRQAGGGTPGQGGYFSALEFGGDGSVIDNPTSGRSVKRSRKAGL
jgi:hypothetical protein